MWLLEVSSNAIDLKWEELLSLSTLLKLDAIIDNEMRCDIDKVLLQNYLRVNFYLLTVKRLQNVS